MKKEPFDADWAEPMRRFTRSARESSREPDPLLCRHLQSKGWYAPDPQGEKAAPRPGPGTPYICLRTLRPAGPDGMLALPEDCTDERICFEASLERELDS